MMRINKYIVAVVFVFAGIAGVKAQSSVEDANYMKVITERSNKIVTNIGITDSAKFKKVRDIIVNQYHSLSTIHDARNAEVKEIKEKVSDKAAANAQIAAIDTGVKHQLDGLHKTYLAKLGALLTPA